MGDYRFIDGTTVDTTGIILTATNSTIPPDTANGAWRAYLVWKAVPNTPDPATALVLSAYKKAAKAKFDGQANVEFAKDLRLQSGAAAGTAFWHAALIEDMERYEDDLTPTAAEYPLMNELITIEGADLAAVKASIRTWWDAVKVRVGQVGKVLWKAEKDVNAAATVAAVDAVTATWPAGGAGE